MISLFVLALFIIKLYKSTFLFSNTHTHSEPFSTFGLLFQSWNIWDKKDWERTHRASRISFGRVVARRW